MRGSGAAIGLAAFSIAGLILLILKALRIKHTVDLEDMAGIVVIGLMGLAGGGVFLYCIGIALGICRRLNQLGAR
jgi:hypothetical protein